MEKINKTALKKCIDIAKASGAPKDQVERLLNCGYIPLPWQWEFHATARLADKNDGPVDIGVGGARGPGKSHAVLSQSALDDCQRVSNLKGLFLRQTGIAAKESFDDLVEKVLRGRIDYERTGALLRFPNGSRIILGGFKDASDIDKYIGIEYDFIIVEELNQLTEDKYTKLRGSLRTSKVGWRPRMYTSFNPGGIGHAFVKNRYVVPFKTEKQKETRFIGATYKSNPYLNKEYIEYLEGLEGELGKAWREGEWEIFAGQVFDEWRDKYHVVKQINYPLDLCKRIIGFDWGYNHPGCALWLAFTPENRFGISRCYVYREIWQNGKTPEEWAIDIDQFTKIEKVDYMVLPHDCFANQQGYRSIASIFYDKLKISILKGKTQEKGSRLNRVAITHAYLSFAPDRRPYMQIHASCINTIRTLPELIYSKTNVEDVDKSLGNDDCWDALAIGLMTATANGDTAGPVKPGMKKLPMTSSGMPIWIPNKEGELESPDFWHEFKDKLAQGKKKSWESS